MLQREPLYHPTHCSVPQPGRWDEKSQPALPPTEPDYSLTNLLSPSLLAATTAWAKLTVVMKPISSPWCNGKDAGHLIKDLDSGFDAAIDSLSCLGFGQGCLPL